MQHTEPSLELLRGATLMPFYGRKESQTGSCPRPLFMPIRLFYCCFNHRLENEMPVDLSTKSQALLPQIVLSDESSLTKQ